MEDALFCSSDQHLKSAYLSVSGTLEEQDVKSWVVSLGMRLSVYHTRALSALSDCFPETVGCVAPKVEQVLAY